MKPTELFDEKPGSKRLPIWLSPDTLIYSRQDSTTQGRSQTVNTHMNGISIPNNELGWQTDLAVVLPQPFLKASRE